MNIFILAGLGITVGDFVDDHMRPKASLKGSFYRSEHANIRIRAGDENVLNISSF